MIYLIKLIDEVLPLVNEGGRRIDQPSINYS